MHRRGHKSGLLLDVLCTVPSGSSLSVLTGHALRDKPSHYMYERRTFHWEERQQEILNVLLLFYLCSFLATTKALTHKRLLVSFLMMMTTQRISDCRAVLFSLSFLFLFSFFLFLFFLFFSTLFLSARFSQPT